MNFPFLADIGAATNAEIGLWVIICFCVVTGLGSVVTVVSVFATRRETDKLDTRVTKLEEAQMAQMKAIYDLGNSILAKIESQKDALVHSADRRSSVLHNRINPVSVNLSEMKGGMEAFTLAFNNFTEVMKAMISQSNKPATETK